MKLNNKFILVTLCLGLVTPIFAKQDDLTKEVDIKAQSWDGDLKANQINYYGNVTVTQGSIKIIADQLHATKDKQNGNGKFVAYGKPAKFSQILDDGKLATASAENVTYEQVTGDLVLSGDARLDVGGIKMNASLIRYNIENQHVAAKSSVDGKSGGRVQTIIPAETYQGSLNKNGKSTKSAEKKQ